MKPKHFSLFVIAAIAGSTLVAGQASAADLYWKSTVAANAWTGAFWGTTAGGPYTTAWVPGSGVVFEGNDGTALAITGATTDTGNITANEDVVVTAAGTLGTGGTVATITVAAGKTLNFQGQALSVAAGTGYVKEGSGTWSLTGASYPGGLTLNAGTIAAGGVNALGTGGALTINGGAIRSTTTAARTFVGKLTGITVAGDFILGDVTNNGALTFDAAINLGAANRTITVNSGVTFNGSISGDTGVGFTKGGPGLLTLAASNYYDGVTTIAAGTLLFPKRTSLYGADTGMWNAGKLVVSPGATLGLGIGGTDDFTAAEVATLAALAPSLALSTASASTTYSGVITGSGFTKLGANTLTLTGTNTYSGGTVIAGGTLQVSSIGNNTATPSNLGTTGGISYTASTTLLYTGAGETTDRVINYNSPAAGGFLTNNGTGPLVFTNPFTTTATAAFGITFNGAGSTTINGITSPQAMNFNKTGIGILTVTGPVVTKYTAPNGNIRADGGILRFASTASTGSGTDAGGITRSATGGGVLQIASGAAIQTNTANTNGILGGWATVDNSTWAKTNGTGTAIDSFTAFTTDVWAAGNNTDVTIAGADPASDSSTHSLRFNESGTKTLTLAGINKLTSGGLLVTSAVGGNTTTLNGGTLVRAAASDIVVHQHNAAGDLVINSIIADNTPASRTGATTNTSKIITGLSSTADLAVGMTVTGTGIAANSTIATIDSASQITLNNNATANGTPNLSFRFVTALTKVGAGSLVLGGVNTHTGATNVLEGSLAVNANNGGKVYNLGRAATLRLGYSTGDSVYNYGVTVNGAGTDATTGLYLQGGRIFTLQSGLNLLVAPTTVRGYDTGSAVLAGWDTNGTHLTVAAEASGSVIDEFVDFKPGGYGYRMNIGAGANTATGDVTFKGMLTGATNGNNTHYRKLGLGSLKLTGASTNAAPVQIWAGSVILSGGDNRLGAGSSVLLGNGTGSGRLILDGISQTLIGVNNSGTGTGNSVVGGSATLSTLVLNNASASTMATTLGGGGTHDNNLALAKSGAGVLTVTGTNTHTGGTILSGGALELGSIDALGTTGTISMNGGALRYSAANTEDYTARLRLEDEALSGFDTNGQDITFAQTLAVGTLGNGGLNKLGDGTLTISANQVYQGPTQVTGGVLLLDYSTANGSKLSNTADLTLAGGTLRLSGGSHTEVVGATYVTGNSTIDRTSGTATIALGEITRSGIVTLNIAATGIATTTTANDESGRLPAWITVAGAPAANDGFGKIVTFSGFSDVVRLGGKIQNNPTANVRIIDGGLVGNITPAATGVTNISSLLQNASGGTATVTLGAGDTLRLGAVGEITVPATSSPLIIESGVLTAGGVADAFGDLSMTVDGSLAVLSQITDNGTGVVALAKTGTGTLALGGANSHSGDTTLTGGTLQINHPQALGLGSFIIQGGVIDNASGDAITVADTIAQQWNGDFTFTGTKDLTFTSGTVTLNANRTVNIAAGLLGIGGSLNGDFALTKDGSGTLSLANGNWTGLTTVNGGTLEVLAKTNDVPYLVKQGATLKLGYITGGGYANTNLKVNGDGVDALTGLYLKGGASYNCSASLELLTAPTTIRYYGTGVAALGMFDINGAGLVVSAAASGSVIDPNIHLVSRGYGMSMDVASGANTATGDLVVGGPLSAGNLGLNKRGAGSILLQSPATPDNAEVRILGGRVITGIADALGTNSLLQIAAGTSLKLNGFSQAARNLTGAGAVINGSPTAAVLTITQAADTTFSGVLGGTGTDDNNFSFTKSGGSQLTLSGANTYTGDTTIEAGTLNLSQAYLADGSAVRITTGATLNLTHGVADTVAALFINGSQQSAGTYHSGNSSFITGSGSLVVTSGPAGYDAWALQIPDSGQRGRADDPDGDGFNNGQEFLFGTSPVAGTGSLATVEKSGGGLVIRWLQREGGVGYLLKESTSLDPGTWGTSAIVPVLDDQTGVPADYDRFKATIPVDAVRKFFRVAGTEN